MQEEEDMSVRMAARVVVEAGKQAAGAVMEAVKANPVEVLKLVKELVKRHPASSNATTNTDGPLLVLLLVTPAPSSPASTRFLDLPDVSATDAVKVVGAESRKAGHPDSHQHWLPPPRGLDLGETVPKRSCLFMVYSSIRGHSATDSTGP
jgi:hypothetical protein